MSEQDKNKLVAPWKLVPVEPTAEMFFSGCEVQGSEYINVNKLWAAMLDAAPAHDVQPVGKFAKFTDGVWREVTKGSAGVPLYEHPPAADVAELVEALRDLCDTLGECGMTEKARVILAKWEGK